MLSDEILVINYKWRLVMKNLEVRKMNPQFGLFNQPNTQHRN